jgi:hypothetical protein
MAEIASSLAERSSFGPAFLFFFVGVSISEYIEENIEEKEEAKVETKEGIGEG